MRDLRDMRGVAYRLGASEIAAHREARSCCPATSKCAADKRAFAEMTKITHNETNPYNARRLVQYHDREAVVVNPPALPLVAGRDGPRLRPAVHAPAASRATAGSRFRPTR